MSRNLDTQPSAQELRILKFYVDGCKEEQRLKCLQKNGFLDIISKCAVDADVNFDKFSADINRVAEEQKYRNGSKEHKAIAYLKNDWRREMKCIRQCIDCYEFWTTSEENKDYFTFVCSKPHLLVFVNEKKEDGARMWPAKVLSVNDEDNMVTVECFGDYLRSDYPFDECFLYSNKLETSRKKANKKYAKNRKIGKQEEYVRSFQEVKKYIKNIETKFGSFIPVVTKVTISDVKQHLIDMYPGAELSTSNCGKVSQRCRSRGKSLNDSVSKDYGSNESVDQDPLQIPSTSLELTIADIKIANVQENYAQHNDEPNNEVDTKANQYHSTSEEQTLDMEPENTCKENRKRSSSATLKQTQGKKPKVGHSSQANDNDANDYVITIDDVDKDPYITENMTTSSRNPNDPPLSGDAFKALLDEFRDVTKEIHKCEKQVKKLKELEGIIEAKLIKPVMAISDENFDGMLDELSAVTEEISECEEKLEPLKEQEAIIRAKIKNAKK